MKIRRAALSATGALVSGLALAGSAAATADFGPPQSYPTSGLQVAVTTSDLNGDQAVDIVSASQNADSVAVLLGVGNGMFGAASQYQVFANPGTNLAGPFDVRVADLNHDGDRDLVTADWRGANVPGTVSIFDGRGDGTFEAPRKFATGNEPVSLALADLNGDAHVDAITGNFRVSSVSVLLGRGDGTFDAPATLPFSFPGVTAVAVDHLNQDGRLDLVVATGSGSAAVCLGNGDGSFGTPTFFAARGGEDVEVADLNADGAQDLAIPGQFSDSVAILLGRGDGTFGAVSNFSTGSGSFPLDVAIADLDSDGALDLASANANSTQISVLPGTGEGTFGPAVRPFFGQTFSIATGFLDGDAQPDLALGQFGQVTVVLNRTSPVDVTPPLILTPTETTVEATSPAGAAVTYVVSAIDDVDPNPAVSCLPTSGATFPIGTTTVTCTATDASGNSSTASFAIYIVDTTPPVVTVPSDITTDATSSSGAVITYFASATDIADPNPTVSCSTASGSMFAIGTTAVICTATDTSGNTANASFDVHVKSADEQLVGLIDRVTGLGPGSSLIDKLTAVQAALGEGDHAEACRALADFANEVRAQSDKKLTPAQATELTQAAARIRAVLDC
jgi:HYR domain/FG-GAP-like repeat